MAYNNCQGEIISKKKKVGLFVFLPYFIVVGFIGLRKLGYGHKSVSKIKVVSKLLPCNVMM